MKRKKIFFLGLALVFGVVFASLVIHKNYTESRVDSVKPLLLGNGKEEDEDKENDEKKLHRWTEQESSDFQASFEIAQSGVQKSKPSLLKSLTGIGSYANNNLSGEWKSRGPYNMPGAFQFSEMDEGTDTVYSVTCGHYGGVQFIWKGTLMGDKWTLINPKNPSRFEDLIVIPNGSGRRVIAGHEKGKIMYSDNGGKTWIYSTGIVGGIHSTIVNRQDNNVLYATDGKKVYKSTDSGTSFSVFQTIASSASNARLYSPRWNIQPNAIDVFLAVDGVFYKLNGAKTSFGQIGTFPNNGRIGIGGDSRQLWITLNDRVWYVSTNGGASWNYRKTTHTYYSTVEDDMYAGQYPAVSPVDPNILLGGYTNPIITVNGGLNSNVESNNWWGYYQNSVGNDPKVRIHYHPDFQATQFFYDKTGKLISLRSSDGGVFLSYNEWTKTSFPTIESIEDVYYNISLFGMPTQETYPGGFLYGAKNINDLSSGTQDQGWQTSRASSYANEVISWDQPLGGDGPSCITGDGIIGWKYNYGGGKNFTRFNLYSGTTFIGAVANATAQSDFNWYDQNYWTPCVGDWADGNRIWNISTTLRKIEYNTSTNVVTGTEYNLTGTGDAVQAMAQSKKNADVVYAMQNGYVFKSVNRGNNWAQVANNSVTGITNGGDNRGMGWSSPLNENIVLFASQSGTAVKSIYSTNGGVSWTNVTGSGANLFPAAEVNGMAGTADGSKVFASTSMGPYVFVVNEAKWYPIATDETTPIFFGQIVYCVKYGNQEVARFSTWGQGVWDFVISDLPAPVASFTSDKTNNCSGAIQFTDQSSNATSWLWNFGDGKTSTEQNPLHTYATEGLFTVSLTATNIKGSNLLTKTNFITIKYIANPVASDKTICSGNTATLTATGSNNILWYKTAADLYPIATGASYITEPLSQTTTYYVANAVGGVPTSVGAADTLIGAGINYTSDGHGLLFNVLKEITLQSVKVYSYTNGDRTIQLLDAVNGNVLQTKTVNVPVGYQRISLDFNIKPGNQYFLKCSGLVDFQRNSAGAKFPYTINGLVSITQTDLDPAVYPAYYYFFYDWKVVESGCTSALVPVKVNINPLPTKPSITQAGNSLSASPINASYSYRWFLNGTAINGATAATYALGASGLYKVEAKLNGCTIESNSLSVVVTGSDEMAADGFSIYPNPADKQVNFSFGSEVLSEVEFVVYNSGGEAVYTNTVNSNGSVAIDVTTYANGVYFCKLRSGKVERKGKFVVKH